MNPSDEEAHWLLAFAYYAEKDWSRSIPVLLKYLGFQPKRAFAHFVLATCFDNLQKYKEALDQYNQFLKLDDGSSDARSFQARQRARILERR